jgi:hypothetical protein
MLVDQMRRAEFMVRLAGHTAERGPYPREAKPDEVLCLHCAMVLPVEMQVEHREVFGHTDYCWAGPPRASSSPPEGLTP